MIVWPSGVHHVQDPVVLGSLIVRSIVITIIRRQCDFSRFGIIAIRSG